MTRVETAVAEFMNRWPRRDAATARRIGRFVQLLRTRDGVDERTAQKIYWTLRERYFGGGPNLAA